MSTAAQTVKRTLTRSGVGVLYGAVLAVLSMLAAGGGHGTNTPLLISSAPFGVLGFFTALTVAPLVWGAIGWLAAPSGTAVRRMIVRVSLILHYAVGLMLAITSPDEARYLGRVLSISPEIFIIWSMVYLAGQVALWLSLTRGKQGPDVRVGSGDQAPS